MRVEYSASVKAQAMFGKRLVLRDYQELSRKSSVAEVVSYLKNQTYYFDLLDGVNEHSVHRGFLEQIIRQNYFYRFEKLLHYSGESTEFIRFGIMNVEIRLIMSTIYALNDEDRSEMIANLPLGLSQYVSFDMKRLVEVASIDEVIENLKGTEYYDVLKEYEGTSNRDLDAAACEMSLKSVYTTTIISLINTKFKGETARELHDLFDTKIELNNIAKIYRYKKYYKMSPSDIKDRITVVSSRINSATLYDWIENCDADGIVEKLKTSSYKSFIKNKDFIYIENYLSWIEHQITMWNMRFSSSPEVVIICYLALLEFEISNLINIIEGIRYHVASEKVMQMLVY